MRVLGISGSLRSGLAELRALLAAAERPPAEGGASRASSAWSDIPPFDADAEWRPPRPRSRRSGRRSRRRRGADLDAGVNPSIPGQLKNALDWASRPSRDERLSGSPAAAILGSHGPVRRLWARPSCARCSVLSAAAWSRPSSRSAMPRSSYSATPGAPPSSPISWRRSSPSSSPRPRSSPAGGRGLVQETSRSTDGTRYDRLVEEEAINSSPVNSAAATR